MIRKAHSGDAPSLQALVTQLAVSYEIDPLKFSKVLPLLLEDSNACLLVLELEGAVCGYALAFKHPVFYANGPVCWLEEILVEASKRKMGFGKKLMTAVETWASEAGCAQVALASRRAKDFYSAIGYEDSAVYFKKKISQCR